jgi:hypothetical protein
MSLRPRPAPTSDLEADLGRMAPGGRRWSESPIPRVAHRRPPRAPVTEYPADGFYVRYGGVPTPVGGGGQGALGDALDSTYVDLSDPDIDFLVVTFPPIGAPDPLTGMRVSLRVRRRSVLDDDNDVRVDIAEVDPDWPNTVIRWGVDWVYFAPQSLPLDEWHTLNLDYLPDPAEPGWLDGFEDVLPTGRAALYLEVNAGLAVQVDLARCAISGLA